MLGLLNNSRDQYFATWDIVNEALHLSDGPDATLDIATFVDPSAFDAGNLRADFSDSGA